MSRKRGPGRPKLSKGTARTEVFALKISRAERAELEVAAGEAPITAWARETLLAAARLGRTSDTTGASAQQARPPVAPRQDGTPEGPA